MAKEDDPSTVAQAATIRSSSSTFELVVTSGPDQGARVVVSPRSPGRLLVGTSAACALRLTDRRVSRRHLALDIEAGRLRVTDLGSTNGTLVNGLRAFDVLCEGGEPIVLGDTNLRVDVDRVDVEVPDVRMGFGPLVGASLAMRRLYRTFDALAKTRAPLLIEGEVGTGKIALADALHVGSGAPEGLFVIVEGSSLEAPALASDATALLGDARGGTLVVRELGDVPRDAQAPLAALVARAKTDNVRVIATTRQNLDAAVEAGSFHEEVLLAFGSRIELPPLRQRRGDVALLVEHFCSRLGTTSTAIPTKKLAALNRHDFPGNVRELERTVTALIADASAPIDGSAPLPGRLDTPESLGLDVQYRDLIVQKLPFAEAKELLLERFASAYVAFAVAAHGGHVARAAAASGLAPRYFNVLRARSRGRASSGDG